MNASYSRLKAYAVPLFKVISVTILGIYLAALPFLTYALPIHSNDCPCHDPKAIVQQRLKQVRAILDRGL